MSREAHVRICEGVGAEFPHATRFLYFRITLLTARTSIEVSGALGLGMPNILQKLTFFSKILLS